MPSSTAGTTLGYAASLQALTLWALGYPDQALQSSQEALTLARELAHPGAWLCPSAALLHQFRRERQAAQQAAEAFMTLATEQGFADLLARGMILRGWALAASGQGTEGIAQMRQGLAALQATGGEMRRPPYPGALGRGLWGNGQIEEGLHVLAEALAAVEKPGSGSTKRSCIGSRGSCCAGASPRHRARGGNLLSAGPRRRPPPAGQVLELRAAMSLSRLWQQQGKRDEARELLAPIYGWFTEGFDTADLQEAKALLEALT